MNINTAIVVIFGMLFLLVGFIFWLMGSDKAVNSTHEADGLSIKDPPKTTELEEVAQILARNCCGVSVYGERAVDSFEVRTLAKAYLRAMTKENPNE